MRGVELLLVLLPLCAVLRARDVPTPRFIVNLDLPAKERWAEVSRIYAGKLAELLQALGKPFPTPQAIEMLSIAGSNLLKYTRQPYRDEIIGFAKHSNTSPGSVMVFNVFYDITTFRQEENKRSKRVVKGCTSIVAEDALAKILHGRNLDFDNTDILRELAITVDFQKGGKTLYTGTTMAGYVGLVTGQKPNRFTVSLDQRSKGDWSLNSQLAARVGTQGIVSFLIRDILADPNSDFSTAVRVLSSAPMIAPAYLIIGGIKSGEGVVITRERTNTAGVMRLDADHGRWYVLETNYDSWNPPPPDDDRRDPAIAAMSKVGRKHINPKTLYSVLSTPPVLNNETILTVIMAADRPDLYEAVVRDI